VREGTRRRGGVRHRGRGAPYQAHARRWRPHNAAIPRHPSRGSRPALIRSTDACICRMTAAHAACAAPCAAFLRVVKLFCTLWPPPPLPRARDRQQYTAHLQASSGPRGTLSTACRRRPPPPSAPAHDSAAHSGAPVEGVCAACVRKSGFLRVHCAGQWMTHRHCDDLPVNNNKSTWHHAPRGRGHRHRHAGSAVCGIDAGCQAGGWDAVRGRSRGAGIRT